MAATKRKSINKGNKFAKKLKTSELKKMAYDQYCAHIATGKAKKSWYFEHPDLTLTWQTMEKYISEDNEFNPLQKEVAVCKGYQLWEQVVADSAKGINKDANTASLQMVMRNKFGWDRENTGQKDSTEPLIKTMANMLRSL